MLNDNYKQYDYLGLTNTGLNYKPKINTTNFFLNKFIISIDVNVAVRWHSGKSVGPEVQKTHLPEFKSSFRHFLAV